MQLPNSEKYISSSTAWLQQEFGKTEAVGKDRWEDFESVS